MNALVADAVSLGHRKAVITENYPVMPTAYIGFMLKPSGFFAKNPANDVPPSPRKVVQPEGGCCH